MALANNTKMANRCGLDIKIIPFGASSSETPVEIKFANEVSLELSSEIQWATGGKTHANLIGFKDPIQGTFKMSTQVVTPQLLQLASGKIGTGTTVEFKNDPLAKIAYYTIEGDTVWQDENGETYAEKITIHKASVKPGYNVTYNGSGDPQSLDIEFELAATEDGEVVTIEHLDDPEV